MFFVGAPLLLRSGASIIPCYPNTSGRVALEVYPAIVARKVLGHQSYKNDRQPIDRQPARAQILAELANPNGPIATAYGVTVALSLHDQAICLADPRGDYLDAVLAAIQAAWASTQPDYGVPSGHEHEGWIADPFLP
jgi:hypothetical protein